MRQLTCPHCESFLRIPDMIFAPAIACGSCAAIMPVPASVFSEELSAVLDEPYVAAADGEHSGLVAGLMGFLTILVVGGILLSAALVLVAMLLSIR